MISESGDQYIDLCLMTQCLDFIIANSSEVGGSMAFNNARKGSGSTEEMVRTSMDQTHDTRDLYCEGWMKL